MKEIFNKSNKSKKKIVIVLGALLLGVFLLGGVLKARGVYLSSIPEVFWRHLAELVAPGFRSDLQEALPNSNQGVQSNEKSVGGPGDTFATRRLAQVLFTTTTESLPDSASTTLDQGSLLNPTVANGGLLRRITRLEFFSASSSATYLGGALIMDFNTSTNQYTSSSNPIYSATFTTSTNPVSIATSTPNGASPGIWLMIWRPGEYLHCTTNRAVSTTNGYCLVEFVNAQ